MLLHTDLLKITTVTQEYDPFSFDRTFPRDDTGFELLSQYKLFINHMRKKSWNNGMQGGSEHAGKRVQDLRKGGKISARAKAKFCSQIMVIPLPEEQRILLYQVRIAAKNIARMSPEQISVKELNIYWRPTDKGTMYFVPDTGLNASLLFPAHFFDRMQQRNEEGGNRQLAICKFLWTFMQRLDNRITIEPHGETLLFLKEGAGLGQARVLENKDGSSKRLVILLRTFISRDMISFTQRSREATSLQMPPLDYVLRL